MLTGGLRNQIDGIWNDFWSGGLANPPQVIEQITYLIFIKRLDEMQELEERKATTLGKPIERLIFPEGKDEGGEPYAHLRWSRFKHFPGPEMFRIIDEHVYAEGTSYARHMPDARFQIPGPALLAKVVDKLDKLLAATRACRQYRAIAECSRRSTTENWRHPAACHRHDVPLLTLEPRMRAVPQCIVPVWGLSL
jgi:hypothetical protein